jgi:hypothetical protein
VHFGQLQPHTQPRKLATERFRRTAIAINKLGPVRVPGRKTSAASRSVSKRSPIGGASGSDFLRLFILWSLSQMAAFALGVLEVCKNRATIPANPDETDTIDRWDSLILRKLLIAGDWPENPAYRPVRQSSKSLASLPFPGGLQIAVHSHRLTPDARFRGIRQIPNQSSGPAQFPGLP